MNSQTALVTGLVALGVFLMLLALLFFGDSRTRKPAPWKYTALTDQALKFITAKQYKEAEAILLPISRCSDSSANVFHLFAMCAERRGDLGEAERRYKRMQKLYPTNTVGYSGRAQMLIRQNRRPEAEAVLAEAARKVIDPVALTKVLAQLASADGDHENAVRLWAQARAEAPGLAEAYLRGHDALIAAARPEEAAELLADAAMRFPSNKLILAAIEKVGKG
jgi:predicted Zn-dependent protease